MGRTPESQPTIAAPAHPWHDDPLYQFKGDVYHYKAPYQLIHDNLLDLSHLGYVHTRTIGGNAQIHVAGGDDRPERAGLGSRRPPHARFPGASHVPGSVAVSKAASTAGRTSSFASATSSSGQAAWTRATGDLNDPERAGFHMRGFHGITPETESTSFYFWTISSNRNPARPDMAETIHRATAFTFDEDRVVIEAQHANMARFPGAPMTWIQVDTAPNHARRIIARLTSPTPVS